MEGRVGEGGIRKGEGKGMKGKGGERGLPSVPIVLNLPQHH